MNGIVIEYYIRNRSFRENPRLLISFPGVEELMFLYEQEGSFNVPKDTTFLQFEYRCQGLLRDDDAIAFSHNGILLKKRYISFNQTQEFGTLWGYVPLEPFPLRGEGDATPYISLRESDLPEASYSPSYDSETTKSSEQGPKGPQFEAEAEKTSPSPIEMSVVSSENEKRELIFSNNYSSLPNYHLDGPPAEKYIELFFGTNRNSLGEDKKRRFFGNKNARALSCGTCKISIPKEHKTGELERPFLDWAYDFKEVEGKHVYIKSLERLSDEEFAASLERMLGEKTEKTALVFIHGFNTSFREAAWRAAQITRDLPFRGLSGFFSWPSSGLLKAYFSDNREADNCIPYFKAFLQKIVSLAGVEKVHIVAHSMGSRVLANTIRDIKSDPQFPPLGLISHIVMGAADIDQVTFMDVMLPLFNQVGVKRTIYASDKDRALKISSWLWGRKPRLGNAGKHIFVANGIDTIDASMVPSNLVGHGYIFETKELLSDLHYMIYDGKTPDQRRLHGKEKNGLAYWQFPRYMRFKVTDNALRCNS